MGLFSSFVNGTLADDIVKAVDGLENIADLAVDKLDGVADKVEQGSEAITKQTERASRVIDVVETKLPRDQSND